jgi:hypothetical protein
MADGNDYPAATSTGMPPGRGLWQLNGSNTGSTSFIKIVAGDLTGTTTPALLSLPNQTTTPPTNPPAHLQAGTATANNREYYRTIGASITSGSAYFSFLLNVSGNPTTTDEYRCTMIAAGASNAPAATDPLSLHFRAGADGSHFNIGIERLNGTTVWAANSLADNVDYLIVLKYTFGPSASCNLYINPTPGSAEPLPAASATSGGTAEPANIGTILFYESFITPKTSGTINIDTMRVDANWTNVTPAAPFAASLAITSPPQTLAAGEYSTNMTVTLEDQNGNPFTNSSPTVVNLSSSSSTATFWDPTDTTNIVSVTIPTNSSAATFGYLDYSVGTPTITAAGGSLLSATQTETVVALFTSIDHFTVTSSVMTTNAGQNFIVTVQAMDASNNPITNNSVDGAMVIVSSSGAVLFVASDDDSAGNDETEEDGAFAEALMNGMFTLNASDTRAETVTITASYGSAGGSLANFVVTPGAPAQVRVETAADGTGSVVPEQIVSSGGSITGYAIRRDAFGNFVDNVAADSWSLANITGLVAGGNLVPAGNFKSAVFTAGNPGTATLHAVSGSLGTTDSGILTVPSTAAPAQLRVETAADGTGTVVPAQTVIAGQVVRSFAVRRDANGYFIDNVAADNWSLTQLSGEVVSSDLVAATNGKSAVFTGNLPGSAVIHATSGSLPETDSGTLTVTGNNQTGYTVSYQVNVSPVTGTNIVGDAGNEPNLCVDPTNPNRMAVGWRQFASVNSSTRQGGYAYTTNGGVTWLGQNILLSSTNIHSDPVLRAAANGQFYYMSESDTPYYSCDLWTSTNGGQGWTDLGYANGGDKPWFVVNTTTNQGSGDLYFIWNMGATPQPNANRNFACSTNHGVTWSTPQQLPQFPTASTFYGTIYLGPSGEVYIVGWDHNLGQFDFNRATNAPVGGNAINFDLTITNLNLGGAEVGSIAGINTAGLLGISYVAVDCSTGTNRGNVYVMGAVSPGGNPTQIEFIRSTNGGVTWSSPKTVNDDPSPLSHYHWSAVMDVAPNGRIDLAWYDTRNATNNTTSQLYYSYSLDGGLTWSTNRALTPPFNQTLGYPVQQKIGEQFGLVSLTNAACISYTATFNGEEDVYFTKVSQPAAVVAPFAVQIVDTNGVVQLAWNATVGTTYTVQYESTLNPQWSVVATNLGSIVATNINTVVQFPISPGSTQGYYRVLAQP